MENEKRFGRKLYFFGVAVFNVLVLGVLENPQAGSSSRMGSSPIGLKWRIFSINELYSLLLL